VPIDRKHRSCRRRTVSVCGGSVSVFGSRKMKSPILKLPAVVFATNLTVFPVPYFWKGAIYRFLSSRNWGPQRMRYCRDTTEELVFKGTSFLANDSVGMCRAYRIDWRADGDWTALAWRLRALRQIPDTVLGPDGDCFCRTPDLELVAWDFESTRVRSLIIQISGASYRRKGIR
jgi:hypothetical protein